MRILIPVLIILFSLSLIFAIPDADAAKSKGTKNSQVLSKMICGLSLCDKPLSMEQKIEQFLKPSTPTRGGGLVQQGLGSAIKSAMEDDNAPKYCKKKTISELMKDSFYTNKIYKRSATTPQDVDGTNGNDLYIASNHGDIFRGKSGHDCIIGGQGDDHLQGWNGDDIIYGLGGNDLIGGGAGNDYLIGGDGNDEILGRDGNDNIHGQKGNDILKGENGNDTIRGGQGHDKLHGQGGNDKLFGNNGNDFLSGGIGDDELVGGLATDELKGNDGTDTCTDDDFDTKVSTCETVDVPLAITPSQMTDKQKPSDFDEPKIAASTKINLKCLEEPTLTLDSSSYSQTDLVLITVVDHCKNFDSNRLDRVMVHVSSNLPDREKWTLWETAPNSGIFTMNRPAQIFATSDSLTVTYPESGDVADSVTVALSGNSGRNHIASNDSGELRINKATYALTDVIDISLNVGSPVIPSFEGLTDVDGDGFVAESENAPSELVDCNDSPEKLSEDSSLTGYDVNPNAREDIDRTDEFDINCNGVVDICYPPARDANNNLNFPDPICNVYDVFAFVKISSNSNPDGWIESLDRINPRSAYTYSSSVRVTDIAQLSDVITIDYPGLTVSSPVMGLTPDPPADMMTIGPLAGAMTIADSITITIKDGYSNKDSTQVDSVPIEFRTGQVIMHDPVDVFETGDNTGEFQIEMPLTEFDASIGPSHHICVYYNDAGGHHLFSHCFTPSQ